MGCQVIVTENMHCIQIPGMSVLWKQLRSVRDTTEAEKDSTAYSVAQLMAIPTPPKYLAYRLNPKMEEYLLFMMARVCHIV